MELKEYEQFKFKMAEIIRAANLQEKARNKEADEKWRPLLARLAEDRFNIVVAGRFSQGKSSLMNALLGMDRLPTGLIPITSVITTVRYGTSEKVRLEYEGRILPSEVPLKNLALYVTENGNPGNQQGIRMAEVQLPAEILRRGFFFVDTPGLGSAILANTTTTQRLLPEIDVLILVTSYESPLTQDEVRFLQQAASSARAIFVVLNKQDTISAEARQEVLAYARRVVHEVLGEAAREPFSVSARDGLAAKQEGDTEALRASGLLDFEQELVRFLTTNKAELFLVAMCERVLAAISAKSSPESEALLTELHALRQQIQTSASDDAQQKPTRVVTTEETRVPSQMQSIAPCEVCRAVVREVMDFLSHYQYQLSTRTEVQEKHAEEGGFCPLHTWHYEHITSPRGVCTAYPALLHRQAARLRALATDRTAAEASPGLLSEPCCPACDVRRNAEQQAVRSLIARAGRAASLPDMPLSALCLPHLRLVLTAATDPEFVAYLLEREAALLERTAEDMLRYAIRHDALKRWLTSDEEKTAPVRAFQMLVGDKNVNAVFLADEIAV